jgi:hypothetical protein
MRAQCSSAMVQQTETALTQVQQTEQQEICQIGIARYYQAHQIATGHVFCGRELVGLAVVALASVLVMFWTFGILDLQPGKERAVLAGLRCA